jgi:integrase
MTRTTLKYLAKALDCDDWVEIQTTSLQQALVLLDAAMATKDLRSQSRSNYRNYLRHLYRFADDEGIDVTGGDATHLWPALAENNGTPRRTSVAYDRFVKWAIGRGLWPSTARASDLLDWALAEKAGANLHWRKDYARLNDAWKTLVENNHVGSLVFASLPAKLNERYAVSIGDWPAHLRTEWQRMCWDASAPLRKGGMRPWRSITKDQYEKLLSKFLGWYQIELPGAALKTEGWAALLSSENCQAFINWLVVRSSNDYVNPSHTAFLRTVRGFHRFLLESDENTIEAFNELTKRCEVQERDKASRMTPYPKLELAFKNLINNVSTATHSGKRSGDEQTRLALQQVDAIIFGLLVTRALRGANIWGIRFGTNLVATDSGFDLRFGSSEMKGHRKFETPCPDELTAIIKDYLRRGYKVLTGRVACDGDVLLVNRRGNPFDRNSFSSKVPRMSRKLIGKSINAHLFRHIVATHAAQEWKLTPTELAAFLAHRSPLTCMKYYEVTSPTLAAGRVDGFRQEGKKIGG